ncbi:MAG: MoaD/ThiS family protein [Pseudomonadota bacterium]
MTVEFYGQIRDLMGASLEFDLSRDGSTVADVRHQLAKDHGCDALLASGIRAAVNDELVGEGARVTAQDSLVFMSPLSGG